MLRGIHKASANWLGRAVMGGLMVATFATLFFVPCVYAMLYSRRMARQKERAS